MQLVKILSKLGHETLCPATNIRMLHLFNLQSVQTVPSGQLRPQRVPCIVTANLAADLLRFKHLSMTAF
jgi:hypothetical protein